MWYLLETIAGITPYLPTDDETSDPQYVKYSQDVREEYKNSEDRPVVK